MKARASQGTIPWFAQIFYYAINGVTDDEGWHVTHADLPQWIEFALPAAQPIGRVVLYTPNLRDYDLQFRGPDGSVQQAEVRGNTRDVAEHVLPRPVATLKLRLVARAVRENARPPRAMVREIEAYADRRPRAAPRCWNSPAIDVPAEPPAAAAALAPSAPPLWRDDFPRSSTSRNTTKAIPRRGCSTRPSSSPSTTPEAKQLLCTVTSPAGYASMGRLLPYAPSTGFFQVSVPQIKGEGYQWLNVSFGDPSGKAAARAAVHTIKPGRYTADVHALHDIFRSPEQRQGAAEHLPDERHRLRAWKT